MTVKRPNTTKFHANTWGRRAPRTATPAQPVKHTAQYRPGCMSAFAESSHRKANPQVNHATRGLAFLCDDSEKADMQPGRYCAVCLTGCAGVAVLGARRPHVLAWNFVVLGLFTVMVLPLMETQIIGTHPVDGLRIFFMAGTIAV